MTAKQSRTDFRIESGPAVLAVHRIGSDDGRTATLEAWNDAHAQIAARVSRTREYRQYTVSAARENFWPGSPGTTPVPFREAPIDAVSESIPEWRRRRRPRRDGQHRRANASEAALFAATHRLDTFLTEFSYVERPRPSARALILLRRKDGVTAKAFERVLGDVFVPALCGFPEIREFHVHRVVRGGSRSCGFDAAVIIGAVDRIALARAIGLAAGGVLGAELARVCQSVRATEIETTSILRAEGRPTLPQVRPEPKPPLASVRRKLPPWAARARETASAQPFPAARPIALSGTGPEDVVADANGRLLCGLEGGKIVRIDAERLREETLGTTGGRPLGLEVMRDGRVLVCDAHKGLLRLDPETGDLVTLVRAVEDVPLRFCSNATAAADGTIWFTESTTRFDFEQYSGAMIEHRGSGRLMRRDPDGTVTVLLEGLHFPNGLTLVPDESAVMFVETDGYRLTRFGVRGPGAGRRDVLASNLPGFADNVSRFEHGRFWVAMVSGRSAQLDALGTSPRALRGLLWRLPDRFTPQPTGTVWLMAFDERGEVVADYQTARPDFSFATGVVESRGKLYLASPQFGHLLEVDLPARIT